MWSAGSLAAIYEEEGGVVIRPGKPDAAIYEVARQHVNAEACTTVPPERILAIGDGPATDVKGANRQAIDALFIGGGIHGHAMADGEGFLESAAAVLEEAGVTARYAMPELAW